MSKKCKVPECEALSLCKGMCSHHYDKFRLTPERKAKKNASALKSYRNKQKGREYKDYRKKVGAKSRSKNLHANREADRVHAYKPRRRYGKAKSSAKERGIEFDLTLDTYLSLVNDEAFCYYGCGSQLSGTGVGLDRLDSNKGYTIGNVVPCCGICNVVKSSVLNDVEMLEVVKLLRKLRKSDTIWEGKESTHRSPGRKRKPRLLNEKGHNVRT